MTERRSFCHGCPSVVSTVDSSSFQQVTCVKHFLQLLSCENFAVIFSPDPYSGSPVIESELLAHCAVRIALDSCHKAARSVGQ
jgi:hypothetical protein